MTGYLMTLNGGPISWKSSRQDGVTLSNSEVEFVVASQVGQEVVYLRTLIRGFGYTQKGPTEIWEDNASCIMINENPTNRDQHFWRRKITHITGSLAVVNLDSSTCKIWPSIMCVWLFCEVVAAKETPSDSVIT
jgi:hypothetical protein